MQKTLKSLSVLLSYPTLELQEAIAEIRSLIARDGLLARVEIDSLAPLLDELEGNDLYDLQERYVALFDRSRTLSLNLFEHVHGESRDRGGAMVDLLETYRAGGFEPCGVELPDHLPVLLEFLSTRTLAESRETLIDAAYILEALRVRLSRRESAYSAVFSSLGRIAGGQPDARSIAELTGEADDDPNDLEALDAVWQEAEVMFGPDPGAGCPTTQSTPVSVAVPSPSRAGGVV